MSLIATAEKMQVPGYTITVASQSASCLFIYRTCAV